MAYRSRKLLNASIGRLRIEAPPNRIRDSVDVFKKISGAFIGTLRKLMNLYDLPVIVSS